ncbi:hypothetical protein Taro_039718 [Colocasia esculenta]|uniref:Transposase Tnp1/En/Spm-like domain-containing protein n=1 Tax=Colocasia esculenta TaxID=4460 RepID=A0A843WJQ2_COLES|nr:hypothetical protein [Colocasia esculenta]
MDFTNRIKGKFVKKELTPDMTSAKPTNGTKHPFNIAEGPSQEKKPKIAYEGKGMTALADEMKVIDLHVPKVPQQKGSTECGFMRKFDVPISLRDFVMKDLDQKWRSWKYDLRIKFFTPYQKTQQHFACSDRRVVEDQWKKLVQIWSLEEFKFLKIGATLDRGDLFIRTCMKKAGGPVNDESAAMIDQIRDIKLTRQSTTSSSIASVGDAYEQVIGWDRTGRIRGIGTGPTPKSLWGSRSEQKLRQDNERVKEKIEALEERMKKIESRGNNESSASVCHAQKKKDSLAGRRVRILNFSGEVVANGILISDDNDNVVIGKKLGGEYYEVSILKAHDPTASLFIKDADRKNMNDAVGSHIIWFREYVELEDD